MHFCFVSLLLSVNIQGHIVKIIEMCKSRLKIGQNGAGIKIFRLHFVSSQSRKFPIKVVNNLHTFVLNNNVWCKCVESCSPSQIKWARVCHNFFPFYNHTDVFYTKRLYMWLCNFSLL